MVREKTMADKRTIFSMPEELRERVRDYRHANKINSEAEAIRLLIERGLNATDKPKR